MPPEQGERDEGARDRDQEGDEHEREPDAPRIRAQHRRERDPDEREVHDRERRHHDIRDGRDERVHAASLPERCSSALVAGAAECQADGVRIRTLTIVLATAVLATLSGCAGPLARLGEGGYAVCMPLPANGVAAFAVPVDFDEGAEVRITSVAPIGADGLELGDAFVMPARSDGRMVMDTFPPESFGDEWSRAVPIAERTVEPGVPTELVVEVRASSAAGGSLEGLKIRYEQGGWSYEVSTARSLELVPQTTCAEADSD